MRVLAANQRQRIGCISFYIDDLHYNLAVKLLNDRYGIQVRGGCSCAGTYGHYLLQVSHEHSKSITDQISCGILSDKPGWVRLSLHPTMTNAEAQYIVDAIRTLAENHNAWAKDYSYCGRSNEFAHISACEQKSVDARIDGWFSTLR